MYFEVISVQARKDKKEGVGSSVVGRRVFVEGVKLSLPLRVAVEGSDKFLLTSSVEAFNSDWESSGFLCVQTRNTVYTFRKVVE